jgi:hypothetical protein
VTEPRELDKFLRELSRSAHQGQLDAMRARFRALAPERSLQQSELEHEPSPARSGEAPAHPGGRPLRPVMRIEDARRLQDVIDLARENGNRIVVAQLARSFKISRDRVDQAIELRRAGRDLSETLPEFSAVSRSTGFVYWPTVKKPRKS